MKRNAFVFAVLAIAILGMLTFGKWVDRERQKHSQGSLVGDVTGVQAPDFELVSLDGQKVKLSDFRGKAVVLNFWATWCAPCKVEMPWFVDLQKQYAHEGLVIVGVAMDDSDPQKIAQFASEMGVNYPVLLGTNNVSDEYGDVEYLPTTFYINRQGKIVVKVAGLAGKPEIEGDVKKALDSDTGKRAENSAAPAPGDSGPSTTQ
ncbi:MAG: TlpA disulfide reductase family protein [Candidatus Korobacteraceae bacterium]